MSSRHVVLIGMPGVGKSAVAEALAGDLRLADVHLDDQIEAETGRTIPEIFDQSGEAGFRAAERASLEIALRGAPSVIACGGGITTAEASRALLQRPDVLVVWLTARPALLATRLGNEAAARPLLATGCGSLVERLETLLAARRRSYLVTSDLVVATDGRSAEEVAALVARRLGAGSDSL